LEYSNTIDTDFVILASSSGGLRLGAWNGLRWADVFPIYQINGKYKVELKDNEQGNSCLCWNDNLQKHSRTIHCTDITGIMGKAPGIQKSMDQKDVKNSN